MQRTKKRGFGRNCGISISYFNFGTCPNPKHDSSMYTKRNYNFWMTFNWSRRPFFIALLYALPITALSHFTGIDFSLPWQPISVLGIAVAFYLGFKNNSSYDRTWEARKIWGGIVNNSRTFGAAINSFIQTGDAAFGANGSAGSDHFPDERRFDATCPAAARPYRFPDRVWQKQQRYPFLPFTDHTIPPEIQNGLCVYQFRQQPVV